MRMENVIWAVVFAKGFFRWPQLKKKEYDMDREIYVNSVCFGILCNFSPICGEERAKEAASFVRDLYNENKRILALAEEAETRAKKAERVCDAAVRLCGKLIALCSPPKEWRPKLFRKHVNRPGDYMGCGYDFLDSFYRIFNNFSETADDELYIAIRDATEKEIIEWQMRMSGTKEE